MTPQEFLNQFGTLAEAEGGVPKLRELIIDLGTLLSQVTRLESTLTRREATRIQLLTAAIHAMLNIDER